MDTYSYTLNIFQSKFISDEGLNGRGCGFWVSKNKLFTDNNATDTLTLHIYYDPKARLENDGTFKLQIKPSMNYTSFTGKINNTQTGAFNERGEFKIELPYRAEYITETHKEIASNQKADIQIIYSVKVSGKFFLGLYSYSEIETLEKHFISKEKPFFYRMESHGNDMAELPVIVRR